MLEEQHLNLQLDVLLELEVLVEVLQLDLILHVAAQVEDGRGKVEVAALQVIRVEVLLYNPDTITEVIMVKDLEQVQVEMDGLTQELMVLYLINGVITFLEEKVEMVEMVQQELGVIMFMKSNQGPVPPELYHQGLLLEVVEEEMEGLGVHPGSMDLLPEGEKALHYPQVELVEGLLF